jgi:drug/metabolite transporter (DMT)-like permease
VTAGLELALVAMVFFGLADLAYKRGAAAGVKAHHFIMLQGWFFAPAVALYGLATGTLAFGTALLWGMSAGLFVFIALYNFASALKLGSVSIVAPIFRLSFTVTVALAVLLLAEPLTGWKTAGLALALTAVWLLLGAFQPSASRTAEVPRESRSGEEVGTPLGGDTGGAVASTGARAALAQALIAMVAMGVANFLYKVGAATGGSPASFITGQACAFVPLTTAFTWIMERSVRPPPGGWKYGATAAGAFLIALIFMFESLTRGEASVLVPITQMGFVVTAAFGFIFLREPLTARKGAGLALAVAALAALAYS